jgi:hypothetical protein
MKLEFGPTTDFVPAGRGMPKCALLYTVPLCDILPQIQIERHSPYPCVQMCIQLTIANCKGFRLWCSTLGITGFVSFIHRPVF